jgi:hypothetical protein
MELVKFWWEPQELMKFEQEAHACTWIIDQLMKRIWSYKFESLLDLLQELDSDFNWIFDFGLLKAQFNHMTNTWLRS